MYYCDGDADDFHSIEAHAIDRGQISLVKISNRFGYKILTLERWRELFGSLGHQMDYASRCMATNEIIDEEIRSGN